MLEKDYIALRDRLEAAVKALEENACYLQAIARKYYLVYTTAKYAAEKHGLVATHYDSRGRGFTSQKFHHNEMADVIRSLYTGLKRGSITDVGTCTGLVDTQLTDQDAWRLIEVLQGERKTADYGPGAVQEPYTKEQANERLNKAQALTDDLRKLL